MLEFPLKRQLIGLFVLIPAIAFAEANKETPEFYWGMSTETTLSDPSHLGTELIIGTRTFDKEKQIVVDDQMALSQGNQVRPQTYRFDLAKKTMAMLVEKKKTGDGTVISVDRSDKGEIIGMKYNYTTQGSNSYSYDGSDHLLLNEFPKLKVNQEVGTVTSGDKKYTFSITYYPIDEKQYHQLLKRIFRKN